jgi:hypothetical protein
LPSIGPTRSNILPASLQCAGMSLPPVLSTPAAIGSDDVKTVFGAESEEASVPQGSRSGPPVTAWCP